jgi:hypothetical protein
MEWGGSRNGTNFLFIFGADPSVATVQEHAIAMSLIDSSHDTRLASVFQRARNVIPP